MNLVVEKENKQQDWKNILLDIQDTRKFAVILKQEIELLVDRLVLVINQKKLDCVIPIETLKNFILENLVSTLGFILSRVCVYEMYSAKKNNLLKGDTAEDRFNYFLEKICEEINKKAIFSKYEILKYNIDCLFKQTYWVISEFIERLALDLTLLKKQFFNNTEQLVLKHITASGDRHCSGKCVMILRFNRDKKLLYKPRSLKIDIAFQNLIGHLNTITGMQLYQLNILNQETHGWCEFIEHEICKNEEERQQYYTELGALLAVSYLLNGTDLHSENIIAQGAHPVIIDYECFFTPKWKRVNNDKYDVRPLVSNSLILNYRSQVRPDFAGIDVSGMSVKVTQKSPYRSISWKNSFTDEMRFVRVDAIIKERKNIPFSTEEKYCLADYKDQFETGFIKMYKTFLFKKTIIENYLENFKFCPIRVLLRSTVDYGKTLMESFHPELLFYPEKRDKHFDYLIEKNFRTDHNNAYLSEKADMLEMNIPLFWCYSDGNIIFNSRNEALKISVEKTGFSCIKDILHNIISKDDLILQKKLIDITFNALWLTEATEHKVTTNSPFSPYIPQAEAPLEIAYELLSELEKCQCILLDKVYWPTLNIIHDRVWAATFTYDVNVFEGNIGMALAYAAAAKIFKSDNFKLLAKDCIKCIDDYLLQIGNKIPYNLGAYSGLGGCIYGLNVCAKWLEEAVYVTHIQTIIEYLPNMIREDDALDIVSGTAGLIICLHKVREHLDLDCLKTIIRICVDRIIEKYPNPEKLPDVKYNSSSKPLLGFSHGVSGFAYALQVAKLYVSDDRIDDWIVKGLTYERKHYSIDENNWPDLRGYKESAHRNSNTRINYMTAWCHGASGIFLSRLGLKLHGYHDDQIEIEMRDAVRNLVENGFKTNNYCLCHGLMGNFDILMLAAQYGYVTEKKVIQIKEKILKQMKSKGIEVNFSAGPFDIPNLMIGGAGISYQLMRIIYPNEIPSILLLGAC